MTKAQHFNAAVKATLEWVKARGDDEKAHKSLWKAHIHAEKAGHPLRTKDQRPGPFEGRSHSE